MTMPGGDKNTLQLSVEDSDLSAAIVSLMRHRVQWTAPNQPVEDSPVWIEWGGNADKALDRADALFKMPGIQAIGVVVDAEDMFVGRQDQVRALATKHNYSNVPAALPAGGLVLTRDDGVKLGAWIMPDNQSNGMLEDFLRTMIPPGHDPLWQYAQQVVAGARAHGADYADAHLAKARIHSYLALRDPAGARIGQAVSCRALDPMCQTADTFVDWMVTLYGLTRLPVGGG